MINILHISDKLSVGTATLHGVTRLFSWWIPRYDKKRFNVSVCSLRKRDKAAEYLESLGIKVFCLGRGKFDPLTLIDLLKLIKKEKIDILHLHGYGATTFGRIASLVTKTSCIVHEHMYDKGIPFYQRWVDQILSRLDYHAISVSVSVKDFLVRYRAIPKEKIEVIYNGVPLEIFEKSNTTTEEAWKSRLNIPESHKVVSIVGRLNPIKGHCYFLKAAQIVLSKFKNVTFLVVGDGELMSSLQEQSHKLKIDGNTVFMGHCDDVPSLLREVDIKVISSLSEGVPITLFEAMAAGCATVSSNVGGLGEILENEKTGFLVPSQDPKALAEKILLLLNDNNLLHTISNNAREASRQFDISGTVGQLEKLYEKILKR